MLNLKPLGAACFTANDDSLPAILPISSWFNTRQLTSTLDVSPPKEMLYLLQL